MQKYSLQRGLPTHDEASARQHCLREGVGAPDLATAKDFLRFHIATSHSMIVEKPRPIQLTPLLSGILQASLGSQAHR
jgi:hypothetical protein